VSFAIGSNNMANAAAPVLAMAVNMLDVEIGSANFLLLVNL
jgi:phosphate/sulfate permease